MTLQHGTEASEPEEKQGGGAGAIQIVQPTPQPLEKVWARFISAEGFEDFLGAGATLGTKGESWETADGSYGVTRSYHPEEQVRLSWHAGPDAPKTLLDIRFVSTQHGSEIHLHHEGFGSGEPSEELEQRWAAALQRLAQA